ncbi:hypothetical protein [Nocardioides sp. B-3]|uniref:hypothetical protein n=1 Tax=Nocardioides sp. B-3 TaxID=2895565 RepID=UPI0021527E88|nr:hypothetical protein [Nocardioides sp. B-3]UUZ58482.1 hypothetical protein LP418_20230 [Nocardioides sp. B-3]
MSDASGSFADELRRAIDRRGLGLERIRDHLDQRGVSVSVATLSYWQSGRSLPGRKASIAAIPHLEEVLALDRGSLASYAPADARPTSTHRRAGPRRAVARTPCRRAAASPRHPVGHRARPRDPARRAAAGCRPSSADLDGAPGDARSLGRTGPARGDALPGRHLGRRRRVPRGPGAV